MLAYLLFVLPIVLGYFLLKKSGKQSTQKGLLGLRDIHGPSSSVPLFGSLIKLLPLKDSIQTARKWTQQFGDLYRLSGFNQDIVVLNNPELIEGLLRSTEPGHLVKAPIAYHVMKPYIANSLLVSSGSTWQESRKLMTSTQKLNNLKAFMPALIKHSQDLVATLEHLFQNGLHCTVVKEVSLAYIKTISEMVTGYEVSSTDKLTKYNDNFSIWKNVVTTRILQPLLQIPLVWMLHPNRKMYDKAATEMIDFACELLNEHKRSMDSKAKTNKPKYANSSQTEESLKFSSILEILANAKMPDAQIIDEVNTMIAGGHSGATALHFFFLEMALNPQIQRECQLEIDSIFQQLQGKDPNYNDINSNFKYLERCLHETTRLYPPVVSFSRKLESPLELQCGNKKYLIPKETNVAITPIVLHHDSKYWSRPEKFNPDRFLPEEMAKRHRYAYLPFSVGIRNCVGMKFGMLEMKTFAAYILRHFEIYCDESARNVKLIPATTLTPETDYKFLFKKRTLQI